MVIIGRLITILNVRYHFTRAGNVNNLDKKGKISRKRTRYFPIKQVRIAFPNLQRPHSNLTKVERKLRFQRSSSREN